MTDHRGIAVQDAGITHAVTLNAHSEVVAGAEQRAGNPHRALEVLLGEQRHTGSDPAEQGDAYHPFGALRRVAVQHLQGPVAAAAEAHRALLLQRREVIAGALYGEISRWSESSRIDGEYPCSSRYDLTKASTWRWREVSPFIDP